VAILFLLFSVQRFGTDKVGYTFAPVISVWFLLIAGIGLYNLVEHDIGVLRAFNPWYIVQYFKRNGKEGWVSLGGIILCVTGNHFFPDQRENCNAKPCVCNLNSLPHVCNRHRRHVC
jgi:K+ transporter